MRAAFSTLVVSRPGAATFLQARLRPRPCRPTSLLQAALPVSTRIAEQVSCNKQRATICGYGPAWPERIGSSHWSCPVLSFVPPYSDPKHNLFASPGGPKRHSEEHKSSSLASPGRHRFRRSPETTDASGVKESRIPRPAVHRGLARDTDSPSGSPWSASPPRRPCAGRQHEDGVAVTELAL